MWEIIAANKRKSFFLFIGMGLCLLVLGYVIGAAFLPPDGGVGGISIALIIWTVLSLISFFSGDQILLATSRAKEVSRDVHPQLFNIVEEMKIAANLTAMPKIYMMDEAAPNAFATGRKPGRSVVAVTTGLLSRLNRDELQGVIAHEISHILNRDILFMTFAGVMLGSIVLIADVFLRGQYYSLGSSRRYRSGDSRTSAQAQAVLLLIAIFFAILAPLAARLLYLAISRRREYLADASGARLTRYPEGLASALEKISQAGLELRSANKVTAPMYIVNPFKARSASFLSFLSTHPPAEERIKILRSMAGGAGYLNYQKAFTQVTGTSARLIPSRELQDAKEIPIKSVTPEPLRKRSIRDEAREIGDLTRAVYRYAFLTCSCGLKIKVPPDFKRPTIICPRCWRTLNSPFASV
ncbi:MAG: M48 family metallopeptidase [Candidatus Omnitrophica bacterium]|nr:M48 family metallopeptidase [Candidatus Omnitrophota bacterium]